MTQTLRTHLRTAGLRNDFVLFVNDINPLDTVTCRLIHHP